MPSSGGSGGVMGDLYVGLLHHPVYDKNGAVVTTAPGRSSAPEDTSAKYVPPDASTAAIRSAKIVAFRLRLVTAASQSYSMRDQHRLAMLDRPHRRR